MLKTLSMIASLIAFYPPSVKVGNQWPVLPQSNTRTAKSGVVEFALNHDKTRTGHHYRVAETWLCTSRFVCTPAPERLHEFAPASIRMVSRARDLPRLRASSGKLVGPRNEYAVAVYTPLNRIAQLAVTNATARRGAPIAPETVVAANRLELLQEVLQSSGAVWAIHVGVRSEICRGEVCNPCQPCPSPPPLPPIKGCPRCPPPRLGPISDFGLSFVGGAATVLLDTTPGNL